jgi:hypothetical protein
MTTFRDQPAPLEAGTDVLGTASISVAGQGLQPSLRLSTHHAHQPADSTLARQDSGPENGVHLKPL